MDYDFKVIEPKWQKIWEDTKVFKAVDFDTRPKFYGLIEFPYPSGAGLHVGHIKAYSSIEVISRKRRMQGYNVLFPIGFDAFGLPTENYAVKTNTSPRDITNKNIEKFTYQLKKVGFSYDWDRVIDTTDPSYYKWTQWIFLKLFEHGLVYRSKALVNYCPHCKVVLSNEDSQNGKCDICNHEVIQKPKDVWYLKITNYAEKLLNGLDSVDFPDAIKQQEVNWIGKSTGAFIKFTISTNTINNGNEKSFVEIYTTRPDTIFGVTFLVIAPEHDIIDKFADKIKNFDTVLKYRSKCAKKTEFERTQLAKEKTGIKVEGISAINPLTGKDIPIFIADYVMVGYGTGAIMAVPAHDQRDWDFANKFNLPIIPVIKGGDIEREAFIGEGEMINSGFLNGLDNKSIAIETSIKKLIELKIGNRGIQYKMKDWAFNRQRYWGEPIPLIHCPHCGTVQVPYDELPVLLPKIEKYELGTDGESPLAKIREFVDCKCPKCGAQARRETDTMPQWAGSSWYYLRYCDPHNDKEFAQQDKLKYWLPVDWYNGGMEHVTRHLLYSRFWHKFLYDIHEVSCPEPYNKRTAQGLILGSDGEKMSKSKGNVIDPLDIVDKYGADTLRTYILFMGDYGIAAPWSEESVRGVKRFLNRVAGLTDIVSDNNISELDIILHKAIKKVSDDIEEMKFNTAIACLMNCINEIYKQGKISKSQLVIFLKLLSPFAPHITEECYHTIGFNDLLTVSSWPVYDVSIIADNYVDIPVQINGKTKAIIKIKKGSDESDVVCLSKKDLKVLDALESKTIIKVIFVRDKIINYVVK